MSDQSKLREADIWAERAETELSDTVLEEVAGGGDVPVQSDYPGKEKFADRGQDTGNQA